MVVSRIAERRALVELAMVREKEAVSARELAGRLGVSEATVRRDMKVVEARWGVLARADGDVGGADGVGAVFEAGGEGSEEQGFGGVVEGDGGCAGEAGEVVGIGAGEGKGQEVGVG